METEQLRQILEDLEDPNIAINAKFAMVKSALENILVARSDYEDVRKVCILGINADGEPDYMALKIRASEADFNVNMHIEYAEKYAKFEEFSNPILVIDEKDRLWDYLGLNGLPYWDEIIPMDEEDFEGL